MAKWLPISRQQHQKAGWQQAAQYSFSDKDHLVPVLASEITNLLANKVIAFTPQSNGGFLMVTLQSLLPNENWFLKDDGQWFPGYVPAFYRSYPFRLLPVKNDEKASTVLCVDTDSGLWHPEIEMGDLAVFDEHGQLDEKIAQLLKGLQRNEDNRILTQQWLDQIQKAELLTPWNIKWKPQGEDNMSEVQGLYRIDEQKLKGLDADSLKSLVDTGAMGLVYGQLFSMKNLKLLEMLHQARQNIQTRSQNVQPVDEEGLNLDQLFGSDEEVLKF